MTRDYYAILGVRPQANQAEIVEAFYELVRRYHPLINRRPSAVEKMESIAEAWEVLSDRSRREEYDRTRLVEERRWIDRYLGRLRYEARTCLNAFCDLLGRNWKTIVLAILAGLLVYGSFLRSADVQRLVRATGIERRIANVAAVFAPLSNGPLAARERATPTAEMLVASIAAEPTVEPNAVDSYWVTATPTEGPTATEAAPTVSPVASPTEPELSAAARAEPTDSDLEVPAWVVPTLAPAGKWSASPSQPTATAVVPANPRLATAVPTRAVKPAVQAPTAVPSTAGPIAPTMGPTGLKYPQPRPVSDQPERYTCNVPLTLSWTLTPGANLGPDEWYVVESRPENNGLYTGIVEWTKDLSTPWVPSRGSGGCDALWWPGPGRYEWRVRIIRGDRAIHAIRQFISAPSPSQVIDYHG